MWIVVDEFGMPWGDLVETLEEARKQLTEIRADLTKRGWDDIQVEIEHRKGA